MGRCDRFRKSFVKILKILAAYALVAAIIFVHRVQVFAVDEKNRAREAIRTGFYGFCETIDISEYGVSPEELSFLFSSIIKDDPYLFFVDTTMSYSFEPGGRVLTLRPSYKIRGEEVFGAWELCRDWVKMLALEAMGYTTDAERALYLHDRICRFAEYDKTLESDNLFSFLKSGKATCQAYTLAYIAVLRECGIKASYVASDTIEHIWNCVKIDGEWYHVDLTWDDSAATTPGSVSRRHFLLSDKAAEERGHRDWYSFEVAVCSSDKYVDFNFDSGAEVMHLAGDGNHDGRIELVDLLNMRRYLSLKRSDELCSNCLDLNADGSVDNADVEALRKKLLGAH